MKLTVISFLALALSQGITAAPTDNTDAAHRSHEVAQLASRDHLEKRAVDAVVTADALRYRTCPREDNSQCPAMGQYSRGTQVTIQCWTDTNTTPVNGDYGWGLLGNGYWSSLYYLDWVGTVYYCP